LQAFAATNIVRGFLGHLDNTIATLKFFVLNVFNMLNAEIIGFLKFSIFYVEQFKNFISLF